MSAPPCPPFLCPRGGLLSGWLGMTASRVPARGPPCFGCPWHAHWDGWGRGGWACRPLPCPPGGCHEARGLLGLSASPAPLAWRWAAGIVGPPRHVKAQGGWACWLPCTLSCYVQWRGCGWACRPPRALPSCVPRGGPHSRRVAGLVGRPGARAGTPLCCCPWHSHGDVGGRGGWARRPPSYPPGGAMRRGDSDCFMLAGPVQSCWARRLLCARLCLPCGGGLHYARGAGAEWLGRSASLR